MTKEAGNSHIESRLGFITVEPCTPVTAGSVGQWKLIYTAGSYGIDEGGTIMLVQRMASDWQIPQFDKPDQIGYTTILTNASAKLKINFQRKRYKRPWQKWCLVIDVTDGYIAPGETVVLTLGDKSQGGPGIRAQTFIETAHEFRILIDPTNAAVFRPLPTSPTFPIVSGKIDRLICIVPSQCTVNDQVEIYIKGEDYWGNPVCTIKDLALNGEGSAKCSILNRVLHATSTGTLRIKAENERIPCESNPMMVFEDSPEFYRYWGDLHGQTASTVGTGTFEQYFAFGRDIARLDFISHQGNDFMVTDEHWQYLNQINKSFNQKGKYIVFPGYEWSGNTSSGGDHNVIYLDDDQPIFRSSHWQIPDTKENDLTPAHPITALYNRFSGNKNVILIPHVGGRFADVRHYFDENLTPVVEIVSCHGVFEWILWDALDKGHIVGVVCNSDGHKGRPGAEGPGAGQFGIYGGLTCVLAKELTRKSIFQAIKHRRCYGTTGKRILLSYEANGHPMGSIIRSSNEINLFAMAVGTGPLDSLMLYRGREVIQTIRPNEFNSRESSKKIRISWEGARIRGRARRATWDGEIIVEGSKIVSAKTFAFDSPADGITYLDDKHIKFKSSTTGDTDGIDIRLNNTQEGYLKFVSLIGSCEVKINELADKKQVFEFGGLGLRVEIEKYPEKNENFQLILKKTIVPEKSETIPYLIKVKQEDGHMAWSSPIYIQG